MQKIVFVIIAVFYGLFANSQVNYLELSKKEIYFGINLGVNVADYKFQPAVLSSRNDSVLQIRTSVGPGANVGIVTNLQLGKHLDLRFVPGLVFSDKNLEYDLFDGSQVKKTISSIYLDFPLMVRFKSEPVKDIRFYALGGFKYDFDLGSNAQARKAEDQVKVGRHDLSIEYGVGFQIYFPYFILSPELKVSHSLFDVHARDEGLIYSRIIDKLFSRAFTISINFEG